MVRKSFIKELESKELNMWGGGLSGYVIGRCNADAKKEE